MLYVCLSPFAGNDLSNLLLYMCLFRFKKKKQDGGGGGVESSVESASVCHLSDMPPEKLNSKPRMPSRVRGSASVLGCTVEHSVHD